MTTHQAGVVPASLTRPLTPESMQPFWDGALEGRLVVPRCTQCDTVVLPLPPVCFQCQGQEFAWTELPGTGTIYSFTVVRHPLSPALADVVPYVSGVVELDGTQGAGARMIVNIVDCDPETVEIGDKVQIRFDKVTDHYSVPHFVPVPS
jgi:uncharacterized OB-fold protein